MGEDGKPEGKDGWVAMRRGWRHRPRGVGETCNGEGSRREEDVRVCRL